MATISIQPLKPQQPPADLTVGDMLDDFREYSDLQRDYKRLAGSLTDLSNMVGLLLAERDSYKAEIAQVRHRLAEAELHIIRMERHFPREYTEPPVNEYERILHLGQERRYYTTSTAKEIPGGYEMRYTARDVTMQYVPPPPYANALEAIKAQGKAK